MKSLGLFFAGALLFAGISLGIGYGVAGDDIVVQGSAAFGLTFVPAAFTLAWVLFSFRSAPELQLLASLGGSGLRMAIALGGGFFLTNTQPQTFGNPFWSWLILYYLVLLAVEITLVVRQAPKPNGSAKA